MRHIQTTPRFDHKLKAFVESHPDLRARLLILIGSLAENPFVAKHKTHRLSGKLKGLWGASITFHYRIAFILTDEVIIFVNLGSHDEVY